jgi:4-hydroxy-2-oxoheptanedioate aldolase
MKTKFGLFIKCPHPEIIECLGYEKADFAVVDMEHTPVTQNTLYPLVLAANLHSLDLIVRIPENKETYFKWCLDLGIKSIQIPHIQTPYDVRMAVKYSNFSPLGDRGLCRFVRAANYSSLSKDEYISKSNEQNSLIFQIEGEAGVNNIDEIINELPANSRLFIGPYDLSQSLGIPGQIWDKKVVEKMSEIIKKCKDNNIKIGTFTDSYEGLKYWTELELDFIEYASDLNVFMSGFKSAHSIVINAMKDKYMKFGNNYQ